MTSHHVLLLWVLIAAALVFCSFLRWWLASVTDPLDAARGATATATAHLRVFGGVCWAALADVRLGAGRAFVFISCRLIGGCLGVERVARSFVIVVSALLQDGWAEDGWVGGRQCSVQFYLSADV